MRMSGHLAIRRRGSASRTPRPVRSLAAVTVVVTMAATLGVIGSGGGRAQAAAPPPTLAGVVSFGDTFGNPNVLSCNSDFSGTFSFAGSGSLLHGGYDGGTFDLSGIATVAEDLSVSAFTEYFTFSSAAGTVHGVKMVNPQFANPSNPGFGICTGATGEAHANWSMEYWATIVSDGGAYLDHGVGQVNGVGNNANLSAYASGETFVLDSMSSDQPQTARLTSARCAGAGYRTVVDPATGRFYASEAECLHDADSEPPALTITVPDPAHGQNGWFDAADDSPVNVTVSADDSATGNDVVQSIDCTLDGAAAALVGATGIGSSPTVSGTLPVSGDGRRAVSCTATDGSGNRSSPSAAIVAIDATPPDVGFAGNHATYTLDQTVSITCWAGDALSGLASSRCPDVAGPASSFPPGPNTFAATATDRAGNVSVATVTLTVVVTAEGLSALIAQMLPGGGGFAKSLQSDVQGIASAPNQNAREGKVNAFQNHVAAQSGKKLTMDQADLLISLVGVV